MKVFHLPNYQCSECNQWLAPEIVPGRFPSETPIVKLTHAKSDSCSESEKVAVTEPRMEILGDRPFDVMRGPGR